MKTTTIQIDRYIAEFGKLFPEAADQLPWQVVASTPDLITKKIKSLANGYTVKGNVAIHKTATIEEHVTLKGPIIISAQCFIASHCYLRNGVYLGEGGSLGPGCEIKSSIIFPRSVLAHFNFAGDSLLGSDINMEAGAVIANCYNERVNKEIQVLVKDELFETRLKKFGALVGDNAKIGANAVLSPGTVLSVKSIVKRLELVEQIRGNTL